MKKLLHSADWHLDAPLTGHTPEQTAMLRQALLDLPGKVVSAAKRERCDGILLSGDLFDGPWSRDSYEAVYRALKEAGMPVFLSPGNHDYAAGQSCYVTQPWPENVHIFRKPYPEAVDVPEWDCQIWGAAFVSTYSEGILENFRVPGGRRYAVGVFHADPVSPHSPYCPVSAQAVRASGFTYLALGHIHKGDSFRAGQTLCAWPGCPMGRGFDETGEKGVLVVSLGEQTETRFLPLDTLRFYDLQAEAGADPESALARVLPAAPSRDFYRVTLTGEWAEPVELATRFPHIPHLQVRDRTVPPIDLWASAGEDSLEGVYFGILRSMLTTASPQEAERIALAARISHQILNGQEVQLP